MRAYLLSPLTAAFASLVAATSFASPPRPTVVELFTSEGCSSCPPAEALLGELAQQPDVLALAFHVDYWDELGWRDRFVIPEATPRQRGYARAFRLSSVYTPQMVVDGSGEVVGSDRARVLKSLQQSTHIGVPVQALLRDDSVAISVGAADHGTAADVMLVSFTRSAVSPIGRGENAGRTLTEYNIVRGVKPLGRYDGNLQTYQVPRAALPKDATDVAVIVQMDGQHAVLGAATCALR